MVEEASAQASSSPAASCKEEECLAALSLRPCRMLWPDCPADRVGLLVLVLLQVEEEVAYP